MNKYIWNGEEAADRRRLQPACSRPGAVSAAAISRSWTFTVGGGWGDGGGGNSGIDPAGV